MINVGGPTGLSRFVVYLVRSRHLNRGSSREMLRESKIAVCSCTFVDGARVSVELVLELIVCVPWSCHACLVWRWRTCACVCPEEEGIRRGNENERCKEVM